MIVEVDFLDHWKTQLLIQLLEDQLAPLYLLRLWGHCQNRKTHGFPVGSKKLLAAVCKYPVEGKKTAEEFHASLVEAGFVDEEDRNGDHFMIVHDWDSTNASLVASWTNGKKGGRPKNKPMDNPQETHGLLNGAAGLTHGETDREEREDREEKRESIAPAKDASLEEFHAAFQSVHPECARVGLCDFISVVAACRIVFNGEVVEPDVYAALNDFRINCCSMTTFRPQGAVQKFRNYLVQATAQRLQALEKQQKNKPIRRNSIATAGK